MIFKKSRRMLKRWKVFSPQFFVKGKKKERSRAIMYFTKKKRKKLSSITQKATISFNGFSLFHINNSDRDSKVERASELTYIIRLLKIPISAWKSYISFCLFFPTRKQHLMQSIRGRYIYAKIRDSCAWKIGANTPKHSTQRAL